MRTNFTKGLVIGSVIGASIGMVMNRNGMKSKTRKRMMRGGRNLFRKSTDMVGDMIDMFR